MLNRDKRKVALLAVVLCLALVLSGLCTFAALTSHGTATPATIPTTYLKCTYAINYDDLNQVVGDADYVFTGTVQQKLDTEYENSSMKNFPYTSFQVTVRENIKGELVTSSPIVLRKAGGLSKDGKEVILYDEDTMPEVGETYVFFAYAQSDGSLLVAGPVSNVKTTTGSNNTEIKDAYQNQVVSNRARSVSEYCIDPDA